MNETSPAARHEQNYNLPRHIQHLIDSVNDVLFITNEAGYFTYVNSQIMRLFGYTPDDVLGQHFSTYLHPNCRSQITDYYVRQFKERIPESRREFEIVTYSGEARWIEQNVTLIIEGDRVVGCCGIARDISQRKQMEDKLNESEQLFRSIIEKTEDIIFIKDQDGRHVMINPAFSKSLNLPLDSVLDKTDVEVFGKETGDRYRERDLQVMTSGQTHIFDDTSDREGIHKDYSIVKFPLRSHSGEVRGVVGIGRDITARKQIENAIRISEERFRNLAEMTAALVFVCRQKNQLVYVNPALIEATGYTLNELLTKSFIELVHPNDRQFLLEWEHYRPEDVSATRHELRLKRKDESDCWIDIALKAVVMADTTVIVGTGLDITERQRHESQLRDNQLYIAAVPDAVYVYDFTEQRVIFSNKKISEMLGYDAREVELFDENFLPRFVHPDDQRIFLAQNKDLQKISDGEFLEFTFRMQGADATWHWINVKNRVFKRSPAGKVTQALGVARNVTEQKITEEYLRKSEAQAQQFHEYLKALNEINIELSETESFDDLCRRAIELGRNRLRFDRLGLLMLDENSGEVIGTYGTDVDGNLRDERAIRIAKKNNFDWVLDALAEKRRVKVWHDVALYDNWQVVGRGWNAMAVLLSDKGVIGWLAADNLTRHEPLQDYQLELLSLYAATLEHICIRKRSEDALRTTQMRYQAVIQDQTELICRYLPDTRLTFVNDAMCRYFGRTHEEMLGKSFLADVPVEFREMITDQIQRSIQTGQPFTYQHSVRFPNGRLRWQEWTDRPIFDKNGQLLEFQSMGRDIEERRRNEAERNEYISRLEIIRQVDVELTEQLDINYVLRIAADAAVRISQARAGIIHLLEGNVLRVAQVAGNFPPSVPGSTLTLDQGIAGRVARNLVPELVLNVYEDPDYIPTIAESHAQITLPLVTQDRLIGILNVQTNEPDLFSLSMFEFLQLLAARIASAIDNARLHQQTAEQLAELKQLYQQVSELEQLKTQMIRIAAHDLRNPLGVVNGFLQLLESELSSYMTERNYEQVDAIKEGVKRIDKITRDILTLERMSAGQEIVKEPVDIRQLVVHAFEESRPQAVAKKHDYGLDIQPEPIIIRGDRYLLPETITNLIINAIKYTPEGGQVTVRLTMEGQQVTFTVQDNGYGIPADQQNNLFQPFYRVKTKETRTIKGTGLGLHLVKTVIERHNGQMCFESEYGKGSTFGFNLPLMKTELPKRKRSSKTKRS